MDNPLECIRSIADFQFGKGVGAKLFPRNVKIAYSKRTGRIRYVFLEGKRLATLRPTDGLFSLSITGAKRMAEKAAFAKCFVIVKNDVAKFIADGGDAFATHVVKVNEEIRPRDEVIVTDERGKVLAVGKAVLSSDEMKTFKRGVAVKIRRGCSEES